MADDKKGFPGPKTEDTKKDKDAPAANVAGANRDLQDRRGSVMGDNTSSTAGANNPGQQGRDGGEIDGVDNNPAPSKAAIDGTPEAADANKEDEDKDKEVKKL